MKDYKDHIDISELYIFYKYENNNRIIVYASSYLEAKYAVLQFYPFGENIFNLNEYLLQKIPTDKLFEILNIEKNIYAGYQFILTEYEYTKLEPYIINKSTSMIHHQMVLTKQFIEANGGDTSLLPSTKEFINNLQEITIYKESLKNQINQLLTVVGDIWYIMLRESTGFGYKYIFGKSRLQCQNLANKENKETKETKKYKTKETKKYNVTTPELLIKDANEITANEINLYKIMVDCIKTNNIKKFPFSTLNYE